METWADEEFGHAALGHALRVKAVVRTARGCAERPAGKVTEVFQKSADRASAFRWVENVDVESRLLTKAAGAAAATASEIKKLIVILGCYYLIQSWLLCHSRHNFSSLLVKLLNKSI